MDWGLPWPGPALATQAETAGAQAFCAGEFADLNAYITATEMALGTSRAYIGPGIAYAFARSPSCMPRPCGISGHSRRAESSWDLGRAPRE